MQRTIIRDVGVILAFVLGFAALAFLFWALWEFDAHIQRHLPEASRSGLSDGRFTTLIGFWVFRLLTGTPKEGDQRAAVHPQGNRTLQAIWIGSATSEPRSLLAPRALGWVLGLAAAALAGWNPASTR
jgi:hypothetical protein